MTTQRARKMADTFIDLICGMIWVVATTIVIAGFVMVNTL